MIDSRVLLSEGFRDEVDRPTISSGVPSLSSDSVELDKMWVQIMKYPRRQMIKFIAGFLAFTQGKRIAAQAQYGARPAASMRLILDGIETVEVIYRGQRVVVTADEVMQSLRETK